MHEFAIGQSIVSAALDAYTALEPAPRSLKKVHVVVGGLHQIVPDYLTTAYGLLARNTAAADSALELEIRPVVGRCRDCAWEGGITPPFFHCAACGALAIDVLQGRELYLDRLEVELDGDQA